MPDDLTFQVLPGNPTSTLALSGSLHRATRSELVTMVRKLLLDHGSLLVELTGLQVHWAPAVRAFPTALAQSGGWPSARLALFGAEDTLATLLHASCPAEIHVGADHDQAEALLAHRPVRVRRIIELPSTDSAPRFARALVLDACSDWALTTDRHSAQLVADELVSNAVQHARGRHHLYLTSDAAGLTIGVSDESVRPPQLQGGGSSTPGPSGLTVIDEFSHSWGTTPHLTGKVVWAFLPQGPSQWD